MREVNFENSGRAYANLLAPWSGALSADATLRNLISFDSI